MSAKVRKCSWKLLEKACRHIVNGIDDWTNALDVPYIPDLKIRSSVNIDEVIGVARGGLIPATILSHMLKKDRVYTIGTKLYTEQLATDFSIYQDCFKTDPDYFTGKAILLVDDISDSGRTFNEIKAHITRHCRGTTVLTAAIYARHDTKYIPDFYYKKIRDNTWIRFPFE